MSLKFKVEQIALYPKSPVLAQKFLAAVGLTEWVHDHVVANGYVHGNFGQNQADLAFNYEATADKPLELEVLHYTQGPNWMAANPKRGATVSHLGMHVTAQELLAWTALMKEQGVSIAQTVFTESHTNAHIAHTRRYNYVIFDTFEIIGVDLKFIVRYNAEVAAQAA